MGSLVSVIDELAAEDLGAVDDTVLAADVGGLVSARRRLDAEVVRRVGEIDSRGLHVADGFVSVASWLRSKIRVAFGGAKRLVALSRALRRMPQTEQGVPGGGVGCGACVGVVPGGHGAPGPVRRA